MSSQLSRFLVRVGLNVDMSQPVEVMNLNVNIKTESSLSIEALMGSAITHKLSSLSTAPI